MSLDARIARLSSRQRQLLARRLDELGVVAEPRLVAYVVPEGGAVPDAEALRSHSRRILPEAMIPRSFVTLERLPRNVNGKVDRDALPAPDDAAFPSGVEAPRDEVETAIAAAFVELLRLPAVGRDEDFFDLGGHSLLALRLVDEIEQRIGGTVELESVFQSPTVAGLAERIRERQRSAADSLVVAIRAGGSAPPLFCLHGGAGRVIHYYELARLLGGDQPVYGLKAPEPSHGRSFPATIEELATRHLEEIRRLRPSGPYRLGGYSFGGILAFEIARQLTAVGEQVELVALFDTLFPRPEPIGQRMARHRQKTVGLGPLGRVTYWARRVVGNLWTAGHRGARALFALHQRLTLARRIARGEPLSESERAAEVERLCLQALEHYRPAPLAAPLLLFRHGTESWFKGEFPDLGWRGLSEELTIVDVPGDHRDIMRGSGVTMVARRLRQELARAGLAREIR